MKIRTIIYSAVGSALLLTSCADYLNKMPDDQKTMDMVWKNQKETEAYLYSVYSKLPEDHTIWDIAPWVGASDEADLVWERYHTANINVGNWNPTNVLYDPWGEYYKAIRASFVFENNVDRCTELSAVLKTQYKAEVKFLRGYYYWLLLRQYGPFVLIKEETDLNSDWNSYPRTPYEECVDYICEMLDEAETDLPWTWKTDTKWLGKADKIACKAVKSQVLLMAASPQWNGNSEYASFKNLDGTSLVNTQYSEDKWKKAAAASKALIDAAETNSSIDVKLYRNSDNGDAVFNPYKSVRDLHLQKWNSEVLWATARINVHGFEKHATPRPGGWNGLGVTQRQVDAFFMINGRTIEDNQSGYKEEGFAEDAHPNWVNDEIKEIQTGNSWGNRKGDWNMYTNREARFYASVLYNGRPIPQVAADDRDNYSSNKNKDGWGRAELYKNGVSGAGASDHSTTGYLINKFINPNSNPFREQYGPWRQHTYIRLAEIYLNYIEALNEYDPVHADIKKYWDMIRERAGLPSIFDTNPGIKGNKDKQLEYIIRERQVELCFEGDRYFTTRRRWLSDKTDTNRPAEKRMYGDNGPHYGMNIHAGDGFESTDFYERTKFEDRVFTKKMYLFPISQYEMDRNTSMVQNPWW
ncbi:RagB/SusD family nutrient uptake outer membrane protein [Bacteroides sp. 519]|uniref:RagB/SusD family nutrient uptake outer membrane protein n=1 Tax=Bacteroides sp. 519 TaxID=2302937 RepID=UPI0013D37FA7|nr:RagB/SusD family nutrient uptake outer membrane protein [Bacteroides sp. 519]NDV60111.1 RagB/SusD family nutrient uptake outer membrane protein [Bacteroides sp. 519]